jgi:hypothetical protein
MQYVLGPDHVPVPEPDFMAWCQWLGVDANRHVAYDVISPTVGVSTIFLGVEHNRFSSAPTLFETMVFDGDGYSEQRRYRTWDEAKAGHAEVVARLRAQLQSNKS